MRLSALLPTACAMVGFVLSILCLFAGHKPGFMEDYHIITLNTSTLGHDLIPTPTSGSTKPSSTSSSLGSFFSNLASDVGGDVVSTLDGIADDVADKLAAEIGIKQWYSLHLMDMCEGTFAPNATAKGAHKNVSSCSNQTAMYHFDIAAQLDRELQVGNLHLDLSSIKWPHEIQDGINALNVAFSATFILYAIGIAAAGLCVITGLIAIFLHGSRLVSVGNWGLATVSFLALLVASVIITVLQIKAAGVINKYGNEIGVFAYKGGKYLVITWVSVAVMFVAASAWVMEFCVGRRDRGREYTEKTKGRRGAWRSRRSDEAHLRKSGV